MKYLIFPLLLFPFSLWAQQWYSSNQLGMPLTGVEQNIREEWMLSIEMQNGQEERILYHWGEENRRWVISETPQGETKETFYMEGAFFSSSLTGEKGELLEEVYLDAQQQRLRREYRYPQSDLIERDSFDQQENLLLQERIRLRGNGTLLSIFKVEMNSFQNWGAISGAEGALWNIRQQKELLTFYDLQGRPERILQMKGDEILHEELRQYRPSGSLKGIILKDFQSKERTIRQFNEQGMPLLEEVFRKEILVSRQSFRYTGSDLVEKRLQGIGPDQLWLYQFPEDDLVIEEYYLGGEFISRQRFFKGRVQDTEMTEDPEIPANSERS